MSAIRTRREPPRFRGVEVARVEARSPRMVRVTLTGAELEGLDPGLPAASVRLLLARDGARVVLPTWNGNEFLLDDGSRPVIRTLTPLRFDPAARELDVEIVRHGHGPLSTWADSAEVGSAAAIAGTGRGYTIESTARAFLLAGDESALPAISVLLTALPSEAKVQVVVEVQHPDARLDLPAHHGATVQWHPLAAGDRPGDALVEAVTGTRLGPEAQVWAAGEAAAVQRIRRHLSEKLGVPRSRAVVRGYWKHGRGAVSEDA